MDFSVERFHQFQAQFDGLDKETKLKYAAVIVTSGMRGEAKTTLKNTIAPFFFHLSTIEYSNAFIELIEKMKEAEIIDVFILNRGHYHFTLHIEYYLIALYFLKEHRGENLVEKVISTIRVDQKFYPDMFGTAKFKKESIIREFVFDDIRLNYHLMVMNYFTPIEGENTSYQEPLIYGLFALFGLKLKEDTLSKNLNIDDFLIIHNHLLYAIKNGSIDNNTAKSFISASSNSIEDGGVTNALILANQGYISSSLEVFEKENNLEIEFYKITPLFIGKKYEEAFTILLKETGIDKVETHLKKKSSKFWEELDIMNEVIFQILFLQIRPQHIELLRNRYTYFNKQNKYYNKFFMNTLLDAQLLIKDGSDVDCDSSKYDLRLQISSFIEEDLESLPNFVQALLIWLYGTIWGKEFKVNQNIINITVSKALSLHRGGSLWLSALFAEAHGVFQAIKAEDFSLDYLIDDALTLFKDVIQESKIEEWELVLNKLSSLADNFKSIDKKQKKEPSKGRLLWVVADHRLYVEPMEQTILKNGKWSKPKKISDTRMLKKAIKGMLDIDFEILDKAIRTYGRGYFDFDVLEVWKRLPGHPNVVLESDDNVSVIVEKRPLELQIYEKGDNYRLGFDKEVNIDFPLKRETPTRVIYYDVDKKIKEWSESFPSDIILPKKSKDQLKKVVAALGQSLNIHSHVSEIQEELPEIKADKKLHALLTPRGNNILLELYMKPFKSIPPYVVPAQGTEVLVEEVDRMRTRAVRSLKAEQKVLEKFYAQRPQLDMTNDGHHAWELSDREETLNALLELQNGDEKPIVEWPKGVKFKLLGQVGGDKLTMNVQTKKRDWFAIGGEVKINEEVVVSLESLLKEFKNDPNSKYVQVEKDQFIALTDNLRKQLAALTSVAVQDKLELRVHKLASYGVLNDLTKEAVVRSDKTWTDLQNKINSANADNFTVPTTLDADLRDYQIEGFEWLSQLASWGGGACLADDMGLGKTLQGLALILSKAKAGPSFVVAPSSVTFNWVNEVRKFAPTMRVHLLSQASDREKVVAQAGPYDLVVCSYGLLQSNYKMIVEKDWNIVLLDEAQAIKNKTTKRSQVAMQLQANTRVITTGTPIENNLSELWNLFQFINPGLLGNWEAFNKNFVLRIDSGDQQHAKSAKKVLRQLIAPFILRRKKSEVLDELPSKTESVLSVTMTDDEQTLYEAHRRAALEEIEDIIKKKEQQNTHIQVLAELTKLRQLCCHASLVDHEWQVMGSKVKLLLETVHELKEGGHRALIFSQFVGFLSIIRKALDNEGISYQYLDGSTPLKKRELAINNFQNGESDVFLISLKAGGTGLNLTAADYVIHMDPWWNPAVEDQATDRAYRMGQTRPVTVYRLITKDTIEEKMIALHADKRELADDLLSGTGKATKLNTKELLKLLQTNGPLLDV
ncbi:DEAD/DEAH box helicase [Flammeovirga kamogawensis]|uniref:DEAD/DEAH box helicase n=1 Tax=Flammeovirga kamogawensis TaxID=373891 RepID=A0ABX8H3P1_9BACT|nr:DEAD/DEAH box helicase [Flammeovirga kamogawensis]MBB6463952.1 superfamily II DNA or RNA helicase [Flammeovirga kamogawensis]QWG09770.1 DEAD/DEAH box helicase [Flammeovirga kamogawensis]TRX65280.1 DEAD/DEAH box helicase [Flammeovirga kamogawensis]